jgi:uncharacterized protein DUF6980
MNSLEIYTCSEMKQAIEGYENHAMERGEVALEYNPIFREFGIKILDGGSSVLLIRYCPWCGKPLPTNLRDEWFERLDALGFEPDDPAVPEEMGSDVWWQKEGL